jgi:hypothetical protein
MAKRKKCMYKKTNNDLQNIHIKLKTGGEPRVFNDLSTVISRRSFCDSNVCCFNRNKICQNCALFIYICIVAEDSFIKREELGSH